jgi:adenylosuccinate lyase
LENVALWHERDISHSSAERLIFPDATGLLDFMLADMAWVMDGLIVRPERMLENVMSHGGIAFSQAALLALVEAGWSRDDAYRAVQDAAAAAWDEGASFRERLEADESVRAALGDDGLDAVFDPQRFLRNLGGVFDELEKLPVREGTSA